MNKSSNRFWLFCLAICVSSRLEGQEIPQSKFELTSSYNKAREHSVFGSEFTLSGVETKRYSDGKFTKQSVKYFEKLPCRKAILTILETFEKNKVGYSVAGVMNKSTMVMSHRFPGDLNYLPDSVIGDKKTATESFRSVLPVFRPYFIDDSDIREVVNKDSTEIKNVKESNEEGRNYIQFDWLEKLSDPAGTAIKSGNMKLDKDNSFVLVQADYTVGLVGKEPVRSHSVRIAYGMFENKRLPTKLTVRQSIPNSTKWTEVEITDLIYDFSKIADSEFDLSTYGYKSDSGPKSIRFGVYAILFLLVLSAAIICRRFLLK